MSKRIHHMGMTLGKGEHDDWHKNSAELSPEKHEALMKRMGISKEEDEEWHRAHLTLHEQRLKGLKSVNAIAAGGAFLAWCVKQGWLIQKSKDYYATAEGRRELKERFEIEV